MTVVSGLRNRATDLAAAHGLMEETWLTGIDPAKAAASGSRQRRRHRSIRSRPRRSAQTPPFPSLEMKTELARRHALRMHGLGAAAADGVQPAHGLLPPVRPGRYGGAAARDPEPQHRQHSRPRDEQESRALPGEARGARPRRVDGYLDSVREVERRVQNMIEPGPLGARHSRARRSACPRIFEAHMHADVRPHRPRLPGQSDARRDVPDGDGDQHAGLYAGRHLGGLPPAVAPCRGSEQSREAGPHSDVSLASCSRTSSTAWRTTEDGDGSLLDHSIILYGSNMSNSDKHDSAPLPLVDLRHGYGRVAGGQHVAYPARCLLREPAASRCSSVRACPSRAVGDSTGDLSEV